MAPINNITNMMIQLVLLVLCCCAATIECQVPSNSGIGATFVELDGNELQLARVAHANGVRGIIIDGIGTLSGSILSNGSCITQQESLQLGSLVELMWTVRELKMHLYVGLWSIDPSSPYEWDPTCGPVYAQQQGLLAREVSNLLLKVFGANAQWSWYISQEADLGVDLSSGEASYYNQMIDAVSAASPGNAKGFLASPYYVSASNLPRQAFFLAQFTSIVTGLTWVAPQDGAGSFGFNTSTTSEAFQLFHDEMQKLKVNAELWANVETFMPPRNICSDAPAARIQQQIAAVRPWVSYIINWWAYNFQGAPPCS